MSRIVYQDEHVTEYQDGTEEVTFTDDEWAEMLSDPKYGVVCRNGHRIDGIGYDAAEGCLKCFAEMEAYAADHQADEEGS